MRRRTGPESAAVLGRRLQSARESTDMTQTRLGELIGCTPSQISMIEAGRSGASLRTASEAARALNVSLDYLVG